MIEVKYEEKYGRFPCLRFRKFLSKNLKGFPDRSLRTNPDQHKSDTRCCCLSIQSCWTSPSWTLFMKQKFSLLLLVMQLAQ